MQQRYADYTSGDQSTWALLYQRQTAALRDRAHPSYFMGLDAFGFGDRIPELARLNRTLRAQTGWEIEAVDGQVSGEVFCGLLRERKLPSTTYVRSQAELAHSKEPDMFHDVFGHVPLLIEPDYRAFMVTFAETSLAMLDDQVSFDRLGRAFKWTIEYGLIELNGGVRAYGAGLMSSSGELDHALSANVPKLAFDPCAAVDTPHVRASLQAQYFVIDGFAQLGGALDAMVRHARTPVAAG
ncbi:MAG: phenylalanine-4-hydroxylase [Candidatus Eremiobacteraeota bacterium]|nr:phenylalanine-4-hydroxylase [Candidatus Eremiobacteraeota bacterium]